MSLTNRQKALTNLMLCGGAMTIICHLLQKERKPRRQWTSALYKRRASSGVRRDREFQHVGGQYKTFPGMSATDFEYLLHKIGPKISKKETRFRMPISIQDRFAVTLRFLATGDSYTSLQYLFRISKQSIGKIIPEVCLALIEELQGNIKLPTNPRDWEQIADIFEEVWNLPHCIGAIDSRHVILQSSLHSGSESSKSQFTIVVIAVVDANHNFIFADVGSSERITGGVLKGTKLSEMMAEQSLGLPPPKELPGREVKVPYFIAADGGFAFDENVLTPYPGNHARGSSKMLFNYRLSRARTVVENAFGMVRAVFGVFRKPMLLDPNTAQAIVLTSLHLYNYLRRHTPNVCLPQTSLYYEDGIHQNIISRKSVSETSAYLKSMRNELADYCVKEGAIA